VKVNVVPPFVKTTNKLVAASYSAEKFVTTSFRVVVGVDGAHVPVTAV
jgi:hypothetical protein